MHEVIGTVDKKGAIPVLTMSKDQQTLPSLLPLPPPCPPPPKKKQTDTINIKVTLLNILHQVKHLF